MSIAYIRHLCYPRSARPLSGRSLARDKLAAARSHDVNCGGRLAVLDPVPKALSRVVGALIVAAALALPADAQTQNSIDTGADKLAIQGYDTVAYFTAGRPIKGKGELEFLWQDTRWLFSSAANRDLFASDPRRYSPQYSGFCSMGMALGALWRANPEVWTIVDGKLFLKYSKITGDRWRQNIAENIDRADENWPRLRKLGKGASLFIPMW